MLPRRPRIQIGEMRIWRQMYRKRKISVLRLAEVELLLKRRSTKGEEDKAAAAVGKAPVDKALVHAMVLSDQARQDYLCKNLQERQLRELQLLLKRLDEE